MPSLPLPLLALLAGGSFVLAALSPLACGSTSTQGRQSNASNAKTVGDQCSVLAQSFCDRTIRVCKLSVQGGYQGCITDYGSKCCLGHCDAPKHTSDDKIQACSDALQEAACESFSAPADGNPLPLTCRQVVEVPQFDGGTTSSFEFLAENPWRVACLSHPRGLTSFAIF